MAPNEALDILEQGGKIGRSQSVPGLSVAFFERVLSLFSTDPTVGLQLSRKWVRVLRAGDDPSYVYRARGLGEWSEGKWRKAASSFLEAGRLQVDGKYSFALPAVDALGRAGDIEGAVQTAEMLREKFTSDPILTARLQINLANVFEQADSLEVADELFRDAANTLSGVAGLENDLAKALAGHAATAWQLGNISQSRASGSAALEIFLSLGQQVNADVCTGNLAQVAFLEGRIDDTVRMLTEIRTRAEGPRRMWIAELLGYAYRRLNLIPEAVDCLEEALTFASGQRVGTANVQTGLGLSLLDLGHVEVAFNHLKRARAFYARTGNTLMPALIEIDMAQFYLAQRQPRQAARHAKRAVSGLDANGQATLLAQALYTEADGATGKKAARAKTLSKPLISSDDPGLVWRGHYLRALASGDDLSSFRQMLDALLESRLLLSSPLSRAAFWGDKRRSIEAYIFVLLNSGKPEDIDEAFSVVSRVRSATLIDEILGSTQSFDEEQRATLYDLRNELNVLSESEGIPPHLRFSTRAARAGRAVSRRWHEAAKDVLSGAAASIELHRASGCAALVSVDGRYSALTPSGESIRLPESAAEIERRTAAFRFECMEPLVDPSAGAKHCMEALKELWQTCYVPWATDNLREVSPEDGLWSIPWQAFPLLSEETWELALRLTPLIASGSFETTVPSGREIAVWIGENANLPNIARERDLLKRRFPDAIICESREEVLSSMAGKSLDLVHVSAHGRHQDGNPMFSYIEFPDGPLYAAEISGLNLRVERAVLLSCESARVSIPFRREPDGLARAFLARGALEVVGSSWLLDDDAALDLFSILYAGPLKDSFAENLARARVNLFDRFKHPFYWAGPVLIRGYGACSLEN